MRVVAIIPLFISRAKHLTTDNVRGNKIDVPDVVATVKGAAVVCDSEKAVFCF